MKVCCHPKCQASFPDHYWGKVKAQAAGWFSSKEDQTDWCPEHNPPWVAEWRKKKEALNGGKHGSNKK